MDSERERLSSASESSACDSSTDTPSTDADVRLARGEAPAAGDAGLAAMVASTWSAMTCTSWDGGRGRGAGFGGGTGDLGAPEGFGAIRTGFCDI